MDRPAPPARPRSQTPRPSSEPAARPHVQVGRRLLRITNVGTSHSLSGAGQLHTPAAAELHVPSSRLLCRCTALGVREARRHSTRRPGHTGTGSRPAGPRAVGRGCGQGEDKQRTDSAAQRRTEQHVYLVTPEPPTLKSSYSMHPATHSTWAGGVCWAFCGAAGRAGLLVVGRGWAVLGRVGRCWTVLGGVQLTLVVSSSCVISS